ncbi:MAG: ABC transporter permease [Bacillota bacterium]|nr:ABC transporter permease [Bacillota bacterium]
MTVLSNNLKRILKNKLQLLVIIILPSIFLTFIALYMSPESTTNNVSIIDMDKTEYTQMLTRVLGDKAKLIAIDKDQIREKLDGLNTDYVLVIDQGFTQRLIEAGDVKINGYYLAGSVKSAAIREFVESFINSSKSIALSANGNSDKFYEGMKIYTASGQKMNFKIITGKNRNSSYITLGMLLMFMLFSSVVYTAQILNDKESRTFYRTITAPVSLKSYMLQNVLVFVLTSIIQVTIVFFVLKFLVGIYMGEAVIKMYLLYITAAVLCVSFGVAVSSVSKNTLQAIFIGLFISLPASFLGGCWWENNLSPEIVRTIGKFTPVYWIMEAVKKLLDNSSMLKIGGDILIVLMFSVVLFLLGTWKKEDITA